jgi:hypothetical protein
VDSQESGPARKVGTGEIDGIPAFWVEADGPCYAGLIFRVGQADETVPTRGLTHLVEHLAMHALGEPQYQCNAAVGLTTTDFYARGSSEEMAQFLEGVCGSLSDLRMDRIRPEARVLRTEAAKRNPGVHARMSWLRFGHTGQGLSWLPEFYFRNPRPGPVGEWASERFTRGNCAVWYVGRLPAQLRLPLPEGPRHPYGPVVRITDLPLPAAIRGDDEGVAISLESARTSASTASLRVAMNRVRSEARMEHGLIYGGDWDREPLSTDRAHNTVWFSCMKEHAAELQDRLIATLDDLAANGPTEEEIEEDGTAMARQAEDPDSRPQDASAAARYAVSGSPAVSMADLIEEHSRLTPAACAASMTEMLETAILAVPPVARRPGGYNEYPISAPVVEGRSFGRANSKKDDGDRLIIGPDGVSRVGKNGAASTVRWDSCVAFILEGEGEWVLLDAEGFAVRVESDDFDDIDVIRDLIDRALPIPIRIGTQS